MTAADRSEQRLYEMWTLYLAVQTLIRWILDHDPKDDLCVQLLMDMEELCERDDESGGAAWEVLQQLEHERTARRLPPAV